MLLTCTPEEGRIAGVEQLATRITGRDIGVRFDQAGQGLGRGDAVGLVVIFWLMAVTMPRDAAGVLRG
ncbi:MAG TPA: hypothetical protein VES60_12115 [Nakamurella sp.]|nr:hypothetical protein [Nakamurella sp.]